MNTIFTLAEALCKVSIMSIIRMDIQYNTVTELYSGRVWLGDPEADLDTQFIYDICEDGEIHKVERTVIS